MRSRKWECHCKAHSCLKHSTISHYSTEKCTGRACIDLQSSTPKRRQRQEPIPQWRARRKTQGRIKLVGNRNGLSHRSIWPRETTKQKVEKRSNRGKQQSHPLTNKLKKRSKIKFKLSWIELKRISRVSQNSIFYFLNIALYICHWKHHFKRDLYLDQAFLLTMGAFKRPWANMMPWSWLKR